MNKTTNHGPEKTGSTRHFRGLWVATALLATFSWSTSAHADPAAEDARTDKVVVHHTTPASVAGGKRAVLRIAIDRDHELDTIWASVRPIGDEGFTQIPFKRAADDHFSAILPASMVQPPGLEYYIASKALAGGERAHFASAASPAALLVTGPTEETRVRDRLAAHDGNRSSFQLRGEATVYGRRLSDQGAPTDEFTDTLWLTEAEYHYRFLKTLYDIRFGVGLLRSAHPTVDGAAIVAGPDPGLNYGWSEVNLALHDNFSVGARLTLGASEDGFAAGVGGLLRIGPMAETHLEIGGELLQDVGNRGWLAFRWTTVPRVPMGFAIEVTERPNGELSPPGTRLIYDAGVQLTDGFQITGRIGYAARSEALEGGFVGGLGAVYEF